MHPDYFPLAYLLTGGLVAASCALLGTFLVLRQMSLVSDAISHAILPGIALAFMATQSRHPLPMMLGAAAAGLVTVWLIETLYRSRRVHEDTSIAIVFPALFALGVVLIAQYSHVDLDTDCVIYGKMEWVPHTGLTIAGTYLGPRAWWVVGIVASLDLAFILLFYKELKLCTFDPGLAESLGFSPVRMHYLLMMAVSLTTVAAFESVGAVLVVAFLIVPPAAAYLQTDRLSVMLVFAVGLGVLSSTSGYVLSMSLDTTMAGSMAAMSGLWFTAAWLFAPRYGLLVTLIRRKRLTYRFQADLLLVRLHKGEQSAPSEARLLQDLETRELVVVAEGRVRLTSAGIAAVAALGGDESACRMGEAVLR